MAYAPAPESTSAAEAWLDSHERCFGHFMGGRWTAIAEDALMPTLNPASGKVLARISVGTAEDVDAAVRAAGKAAPAWQALSSHERARYLYALARLIQKHARTLAVLESLDNGKPIRESRDIDIPLTARHFYHHAGWAQLRGQAFNGREPWGVAGLIIPWNFPLLMLAWKVAPALAAGNTVVLKPAETTSLTALYFAELCQQAGLPDGVVNIVTGAGETGAALAGHPGIRKLAFTGSTEVGKILARVVAGTDKGLTLELGGKSAFIVFEDADLDAAVEGIVDSIWFNQGHVCCAGSRLLVQEGLHDPLLERLRERMATLRVGDPLDKNTDIGAINSEEQLNKITQMVSRACHDGATCIQPTLALPGEGYFFPPTVLADLEPASEAMQEEIFGPVLTVTTFRTPAEAIALANNTRYGLAASVWSRNLGRCLEVVPKLQAGVVWVNCANQFDAAAPFGGVRESGYGREGGLEGMEAWFRPEPAPLAKTARKSRKLATTAAAETVDATHKFLIGGKQTRPDSGTSYPVTDVSGKLLAWIGVGGRKDIRNAVEAATKALGWGNRTGHQRAQILYYLAERLDQRRNEFAEDLALQTGRESGRCMAEVQVCIERLFEAAAWADKFTGSVAGADFPGQVITRQEPAGVIGMLMPEHSPLLGAVTMLAPAVAMGNTVVACASEAHPLSLLKLAQVIETSDVPAGVINILAGPRAALAETLARHAGVHALWLADHGETVTRCMTFGADTLKRILALHPDTDWSMLRAYPRLYREACAAKTIWLPADMN